MDIYLQNKYTKWYFNIVEKAKSRKKLEGYLENHHILPKSLGGNNDNINMVYLTAREHYVLHWLLTKMLLGKNKFKMIKAFNRFHQKKSVYVKERYFNSRAYQTNKIEHSNYMKKYNPLYDEITKNKWSISIKNSWDEERRKKASQKRIGVCNITPEGLQKLSDIWKGVKRPKTKSHIENSLKSSSEGVFHTPFGDFYSPGQASRSEMNTLKLSRHLINKMCKNNIDGFSFTNFNKNYKRGTWKRPVKS